MPIHIPLESTVHIAGIRSWDQLLAMAFAQLTYRESLRDIESCLRALQSKLYHMGFRGKVSRSTLADANESHDWRIFAEFAQVLIGIARPLHAQDPIGVDLDQSVLVAIIRKRLGLAASLYQALQILSVTLFEKTPLLCALQIPEADAELAENVNQLILFDI
jgi:hypothetical protein